MALAIFLKRTNFILQDGSGGKLIHFSEKLIFPFFAKSDENHFLNQLNFTSLFFLGNLTDE